MQILIYPAYRNPVAGLKNAQGLEGSFIVLRWGMDIMVKLGSGFYFSEFERGIIAGFVHEVFLLVFGQIARIFEVGTFAL